MATSTRRYDALVIGGGHNGLVCAAYLAGAGQDVCVLERRNVLGGAAVTEEFHPGFRNSTASYTVSLLHPKVIRDLRLSAHGLTIIERPLANFLPQREEAGGGYLAVGGGLAATQSEVAKFSARDAQRLPGYYAMLERVADVLRDLLLATPPNVGSGIPALLDACLQVYEDSGCRIVTGESLIDSFMVGELGILSGPIVHSWIPESRRPRRKPRECAEV